jgi:hypothetical protein
MVNGSEIKNNLKATQAYHPQSSGKTKCTNRTLKITIKKTMPGDPPTMGSIDAHSLAQD